MWKPVLGYETTYEVSDLGEVRSLRTGRTLRPVWTGARRKQYPTVVLCANGAQRQRKVHTLVLEAFVGPRPEGSVACHRDDDVSNNAVGNLYWGSWSDNARDRVRNGNHAGAKLSLEQAADIRRRRKAGESGKTLAEEFGVSQQVVWNVYSGRTGNYE